MTRAALRAHRPSTPPSHRPFVPEAATAVPIMTQTEALVQACCALHCFQDAGPGRAGGIKHVEVIDRDFHRAPQAREHLLRNSIA